MNDITTYQGYCRPATVQPFTREQAAVHAERRAARLRDRTAARQLRVLADDFRHELDLP